MPNPPETLTFNAWQRSTLFDRAERQGARLQSKVALTLTDTNTGQSAPGDVAFTLMAAGDVAGLKQGAIKQMAPAPETGDAETTKYVHLDLWEKDLPWRYTPQTGTPDTLRPWLVLLVGTDEEMEVSDGIVNFDSGNSEVLKQHNLDNSHLWAHTQYDGHRTIARILSPRKLEAQHKYIAVVVPAFNQEGQPMWRVNGETVTRNFGSKGVLPAFHSWRFWTAEAGDFETLAAALRIPPAASVGCAKLHYPRPVTLPDGTVEQPVLDVGGAIMSLYPDLGLIDPMQMNEKQLLEALHALQPLPDDADPALLTLAEKRLLLERLCQPVKDRIEAAAKDLDLLNNENENAIGLPHYGRPWLPNPDDFEQGWPHHLTDDARFRGTAGLGVWMGVEGQEILMDAAVQQAGALREAGQRIGHLALGLWAAGRLWERRLPEDKNERLRILGPMMARMVAADGGVVLDRVTADSSPLPPALFSSAAQRILRDRSPQTRHISGAQGGIDRSAALTSANEPEPQPERAPGGSHGLPHVDAVAREMRLPTLEEGLPPIEKVLDLDDNWIAEVIAQLWYLMGWISQEYRQIRDDLLRNGQAGEIPPLRDEFSERLQQELIAQLEVALLERDLPCSSMNIIVEEIGSARPAGALAYYARVLESDTAQRQFHDALWQVLRRCMVARLCEELMANLDLPIENRDTFCHDLVDMLPPLPQLEQQPIHLDVLSDALYNVLDPRQPNAPARRRICAQFTGVDCTRLIPPEFAIGLDFPTWDLLRTHEKEWLLPGVDALEKDSITALQTNPAFIDAYMVGINSQFMAEMRWRDLAVDRTCTPLCMFWGQMNYATQKRQADIEPLREWAKAPEKPVGDLTHQSIQPDAADNTSGSRLVIVFRSDLFRRYPSTLVYLVKPKPDSNLDELLKKTPQLVHSAEERGDREFFGPIFPGKITPEITFFVFDVTPGELEQYWLVLDEPPAELRFRNGGAPTETNSATFAETTLDHPTRVAISGKELKEQGLHL